MKKKVTIVLFILCLMFVTACEQAQLEQNAELKKKCEEYGEIYEVRTKFNPNALWIYDACLICNTSGCVSINYSEQPGWYFMPHDIFRNW